MTTRARAKLVPCKYRVQSFRFRTDLKLGLQPLRLSEPYAMTEDATYTLLTARSATAKL